MNKSLRRRVAAVATAATVGGLLLPFLAAGSASAAITAAPTALTVANNPVYTNISSTGTFTGALTGATAAAAGDFNGTVYAYALSGPDSNLGAASYSPACTIAGAGPYTYTCTFTTGGTSGTDSMRIFYNPAGAAAYTPSLTQTAASLSVAGPIKNVVVAPTTPSAAQGVYTELTATATDVNGLFVPGTTLNVAANEANAQNSNVGLTSTKPTVPMSPTTATAQNSGTGIPSGLTPTTGDGVTVAAGTTKFYLASQVAGTVNFTVTSATNQGLSTTGALTVNGGTPNDVTTVTVSPSSKAFTSDKAQTVVTVRNAAGNPVAGIFPVIAVTSGPNLNAAIVLTNTTTGASATATGTGIDGTITATYVTGATAGPDNVQAFVNQAKAGNGSGYDAGEPIGNATVTNAAYDLAPNPLLTTSITAPLSTKTVTLTYTVATASGSGLAGYNVRFALGNAAAAAGKYSLSAVSALSDVNGKVTVTLTDASPVAGDAPTAVATIGYNVTAGNPATTATATVTYAASAVGNNSVKIVPFANTTTAKGITSLSSTVTDQFGSPVSGATYAWSVTGRNGAANINSSTSTLSYTDIGSAALQGTDTVSLQVSTTTNGVTSVAGTTTATQAWITTSGAAAQANIDLASPGGTYTQSTAGAPVIPTGFTKSATSVGVTADPTSTTTVTPQKVTVVLADANNNRLWGKQVSFSSSGVGVFSDVKGNPISGATTAVVADSVAQGNDNNLLTGAPNGILTTNAATVFVRSTQSGTQTITATVDGISTNATVTYTGQFVGITPIRVVDTRNGQGSISSGGGNAPGPLAPNTLYNFNYSTVGMTLGAAAYVFNVTAINPSGVGNLRVAAATAAPITTPGTSLINYQPGQSVANLVVVPNNPNALDALTLYSDTASANVAIDLVGYYPTVGTIAATNSITTVTPSRIVDTRNGAGPVAAGGTSSFQVSGTAGIPADGTVRAVALNVTTINPAGLGNLRIFADGTAVPTTSNINYIPGQDKSAFVIVNLPANGKIDVFSDGTAVNVTIDAYAYYKQSGSNLVTQTPVRILDSRPNQTLGANQSKDLMVAGNANVPANAQAVLVSITAIHTNGSTGSGNLRAYPSGGTVPNNSTLNYVSPTADVANFAMVKLGANGSITLFSQGSPTDVAVDVLGYVPAGQ